MIISTSLHTLISNQSQLLTFWMIIEVIRWTNLLSNLGVGIIVKHCLGIDIVLITIIAIAALVRINNLGCKITTRIDRYFVRNSYGLYDAIKNKCSVYIKDVLSNLCTASPRIAYIFFQKIHHAIMLYRIFWYQKIDCVI